MVDEIRIPIVIVTDTKETEKQDDSKLTKETEKQDDSKLTKETEKQDDSKLTKELSLIHISEPTRPY